MTPKTISDHTLNQEIALELSAAMALPADGIVYECGQVRRVHRHATRMKVEQVLVRKYGVTGRRLFVRGKWQNIEQVSDVI